MALAAIVSLCSGILSLTSADTHINKIEIAQAKIENEILRFRMRVGKYSVNAQERSVGDETNNTMKSPEKKSTVDRRAGAQGHNRSPNYYTLEKMARRSLGCQRKYSNGLTAVVRLRIFAQRKGFCSIRSVYEVLPPPSRFFQRKEKHKTQHTSQHDIHNTTKPKHTIIVYHS
jgi:hypothetical protein